MLDRIIQDLVASFCSWRVDMGMITTRDTPTPTPQPPSTSPPSTTNKSKSVEDAEYYRIMSRYPEHMLHCPQTSLYPIFFFIMERWEARRAASAAANHNVLPPPPGSVSSEE